VKIGLFYFSGTGNTEYVSRQLGDEFARHGHEVLLIRIEDALRRSSGGITADFDIIGIGYPIYGFGTPAIVMKFADELMMAGKPRIFIYKSAADFIGINHNASASLIRKFRKKGHLIDYDRIIVMPSNWLLEYDERFSRQIIDASKAKIRIMAGDILSGTPRRYKPGIAVILLSGLAHFFESRSGARRFGQNLRAGEDCNLCGLCSRNCPTGNIKIEDGVLVTGRDCIWCMRCVYSCPRHALASRGFNFVQFENGYSLKLLLENHSGVEDFVDAETKGVYRHFYRYLTNQEL